MPKKYTITAQMALEIRGHMKNTKCKTALKRMEAVALRGEGFDNHQIAAIKKYHHSHVSNLVADYINKGIEAIGDDKRAGGNNQILSDEQEKEFLESFVERAKKGHIATVAEMIEAHNKLTGKERESGSTLYYLLNKHKWRLIVPRSAHPNKASEAEIEASKKLTMCTKNSTVKLC